MHEGRTSNHRFPCGVVLQVKAPLANSLPAYRHTEAFQFFTKNRVEKGKKRGIIEYYRPLWESRKGIGYGKLLQRHHCGAGRRGAGLKRQRSADHFWTLPEDSGGTGQSLPGFPEEYPLSPAAGLRHVCGRSALQQGAGLFPDKL